MFARKALPAFAAFVVIVVLSGVFLPWWGTVLVVVGLVALAVMLLPRLISRSVSSVMKDLFDTKSRVLREAAVDVHAVELTERPVLSTEDEDDFEEEERDPSETKYVLLEATITPGGEAGPMTHWEPDEFRLVAYDRDTSFEAMADESAIDDGGEVLKAEVVQDDGVTEDDFDKVVGPHRLRLVFACPRTLAGRAKLQYYFEGIGDFKIPA